MIVCSVSPNKTIIKSFDVQVASCGIILRSCIIFAIEFDWQNEWPQGASESIVARHIKFKATVFSSSGRIPREDPRSLLPLLSTLVSFLPLPQPNVLFYVRKYFANFAVDANFNSRASIFAESRRKRILMYWHFIRHRTRVWLPCEKDSTPRWKIKSENSRQMRMK